MNIYLTDQTNNFPVLLAKLMTMPSMTFDKNKLREQTTSIDIRGNTTLKNLNLDFLFDYNIFPAAIMTFVTQWKVEERRMKIGDVILQQVFVPPTQSFSQKLVFGVRINHIIDDDWRRGFSYETIVGHVEKGESTFTIEEGESGLVFKIQTYSEPGNLLTRILGPFCTVPYQKYCTRTALENVRRQIEMQATNAQHSV